jgi:hypothetical protein
LIKQIKLEKKDTEEIKVKHPGILDLPEDGFKDWPIKKLVDHFVTLAEEKGKGKISKAIQNLIRWNETKNPKMSAKAQSVFDKYSKLMDKKEESRVVKGAYMENKEENYNGWTNYETWNVNLWLDQEGYQDSLREMYVDTNKPDVYDLADEIKEYVESGLQDFIDNNNLPASMYLDILVMSFTEVNYREIAENYLQDL